MHPNYVPQDPPFFDMTANSIAQETTCLLDRSHSLSKSLIQEIKPENANFENVILPLALNDNRQKIAVQHIALYQAVSSDPKIRAASADAQTRINQAETERWASQELFRLVKSVYEQLEDENIGQESQKLVESWYRTYLHNGLEIESQRDRIRFKTIGNRLVQIETEFQKNLTESIEGIWLGPEELEGVRSDFLKTLKTERGMIFLTFKKPHRLIVMKNVRKRETRRAFYIASQNASQENVPLFLEAVTLRKELARLCGYESYYQLSLESKMAKAPEKVHSFLQNLTEDLIPVAKSELNVLRAVKRNLSETQGYTGPDVNSVHLWDFHFLHENLLRSQYEVDSSTISEYFPLTTTFDGMLQLCSSIFGLKFVRLGPDDMKMLFSTRASSCIWHPDVEMFTVWDETSSSVDGTTFVGYFYTDLHPRPGKYSHNANFNIETGSVDENGKRHYCATALICNLTPPTSAKPSLLRHDELITLLHEFGHAIHDLVGQTNYARYAGTHVVRDFQEAPSQMLENWCWIPAWLKEVSYHYSHLTEKYARVWRQENMETLEENDEKSLPPVRIPNDLVDRLVATRHINAALQTLTQIHHSKFDMFAHGKDLPDDVSSNDLASIYNRIGKECTLMTGPEEIEERFDWGHGYTTFPHLICGMQANYYSYLFSKVYSSDIFESSFAVDPTNKEVGMRYRKTILEPGGSKDENEILEEFLGREPNTKAFRKSLGLS